LAAVKVDFLVGGLSEVIKAFNSVQAAATNAHNAQVKRAKKSKEMTEEERKQAWLTSKTYLQIQRNSFKAAEQYEKQKLGVVLNTAKQTANLLKKGVSDERTALNEKKRIAKEDADEKIRQAKRAAAEEESQRKQRLQIMKNSSAAERRMEKDALHDRLRNIQRIRAGMDEKVNARRSFGQAIGSRVATGVSNAIGGMARFAGAAMAIGGGFTTVDAVRNYIGDERTASIIANSAYVPGERERPKDKAILDHMTSLSRATGTDRSKLLEGMLEYQRLTGDFEGGMQGMGFYAKAAKATGADLHDVSRLAGRLKAQNKTLGQDDLKKMMLGFVGAGKKYAIELPQLAESAAIATAGAAAYSGDQGKNQAELAGLMQIAMRAGSTHFEAATTVARMKDDAFRHRDKLASLDVFDKSGHIQGGASEMVAKVMQATGGNLGKIQDLGFNIRSNRMFEALASEYQREEAKQKGGGLTAIRKTMSSAVNAGFSEGDLESEFAAIMATSAEKIEAAFRDLQMQIAEKLAPLLPKLIAALEQMVPVFVTLADKMAKFAEWFGENPLMAMGSIIALSITKELAGWALSSGISKGMGALFARSMPGVGAVGSGGVLNSGIGGAGGAFSTAASVAATAALVAGLYTAGKAAIDFAADAAAARDKLKNEKNVGTFADAFDAANRGDKGAMERLGDKLLQDIKDREDEQKDEDSSLIKKALVGLASFADPTTDGDYGSSSAAARKRANVLDQQMVEALNTALRKLAGSADAAASNVGNSNGGRTGAPQGARSNVNTPG